MNIVFTLSRYDREQLRAPLCEALSRVYEHESRRRFPGGWRFVDRLNRGPKPSEQALRRRHIRYRIYGVMLTLFGLFLLIPSLTEPETLAVVLPLGFLCFFSGALYLCIAPYRVGSGLFLLIPGVLLTLPALINPVKHSGILISGLLALVCGVLYLICKPRRGHARYRKPADQILNAFDRACASAPDEVVQYRFDDNGCALVSQEVTPYAQLYSIVENELLIVIHSQKNVMVLQKCDLTEGDLPSLRQLLHAHIPANRLSLLPDVQ